MAQRGSLPLVSTEVPQLQGPQAFEQPKAPQFTYTEQVPITPQYRFDIDPGINWAELGSEAFAAAADIYGKSLNYMVNTKANKLQDLTTQTQKKVSGLAEAYETGQLNVPAGMDPVSYAAKQTDLLKEEFRFKARDIIGDFSYEVEDAGPTQDGKALKRTVDIFDEDYKIDGLGLAWQDIIVGARGTDIGLDEMMDRQLIAINKAYGQQQQTAVSIEQYLQNGMAFSALDKDAKEAVDAPFFRGRVFPIDDPNFGIDPMTKQMRVDAAGNPLFFVTEVENPDGTTQFIAQRNMQASFAGASLEEIKTLVGLDLQYQNNLGLTSTVEDLVKTFVRTPETMDPSTSAYALMMYGSLPESTKDSFGSQPDFSKEEAFKLNAAATAFKVGAPIDRVQKMLGSLRDPEILRQVMALEEGVLSSTREGTTVTYTGFTPQPFNQTAAINRQATLNSLQIFTGIVTGAVRTAGISGLGDTAFSLADGTEEITDDDKYVLGQVIRDNPTFAQALREANVMIVSAQQSGLISADPKDENTKKFMEEITSRLSGKFVALEDDKGNIVMAHGPVWGMANTMLQTATAGDKQTSKAKLEQGYKGYLQTNTEMIPPVVAAQVFGSDIDITRATAMMQSGGRITTSTDPMMGQQLTGVPQSEQLRIYAASKKATIAHYGGKAYEEMSEDERDAAFERAYLDIPQAHLWDMRLLTEERNSINVDVIPFGIASIPLNTPDARGNASNLVTNGTVFIQETLIDGMIQPKDRSGNPAITYNLRGTDDRENAYLKRIENLMDGYRNFSTNPVDIIPRSETTVGAKPMSVTTALVNLVEKYEQNPTELQRSLAIADILDVRKLVPELKNKTPTGFVAWVLKNKNELMALSQASEWPFTKEQTQQFIDYIDKDYKSPDDINKDPAINAFVYGFQDSIYMASYRLNEGGLSGIGMVMGGIQMVSELKANNQPEQVNTNFELFAFDNIVLPDNRIIDTGVSRPEFDSDLLRINTKNSGIYGLLYYQIGHPEFENQMYKTSGFNLFVDPTTGNVVALEKDELPTDRKLEPTTQSELIQLNNKARKFSGIFAKDRANFLFEQAAKAAKATKQEPTFFGELRKHLEKDVAKITKVVDSVKDVVQSPNFNMDVGFPTERSSPEAWAKNQSSKSWLTKDYSLRDLVDSIRGWWQSSGTETKKEFKAVYPELAAILDKAKSDQELIKYAPQFEQLLKAATDPQRSVRSVLLGNAPDAMTMYRNEQSKAFQKKLEQERALRKATRK